MIVLSYLLFVYEILRLSAIRLEKCDGIRLIIAGKTRKIHAKWVLRAGSSKKYPVPILEAQKGHPVPKLKA